MVPVSCACPTTAQLTTFSTAGGTHTFQKRLSASPNRRDVWRRGATLEMSLRRTIDGGSRKIEKARSDLNDGAIGSWLVCVTIFGLCVRSVCQSVCLSVRPLSRLHLLGIGGSARRTLTIRPPPLVKAVMSPVAPFVT